MVTIQEQGDFKILFNGSCTYFIVDNNGDAWDVVDTERKAKNRFKKILKMSGQ